MALKSVKTEMHGQTSRWMTREEAKDGARKARRTHLPLHEVLAEVEETDEDCPDSV
jgi:hypothetical protein